MYLNSSYYQSVKQKINLLTHTTSVWHKFIMFHSIVLYANAK